MKSAPYKVIPLKPLTGHLDFRSLPDLMGNGTFRYRQNFAAPEENRLCRREGWEKLLSKAQYNNQDLHDQLLPLQQYYDDLIPPANGSDEITSFPSSTCGSGGTSPCCGTLRSRLQGREYPTLLFEATATTGARSLISGTQSRLYQLNETSGNWRVLADGRGGGGLSDLSRRFYAAQVKDTVVFTNDFDPVLAYDLYSPPQGCGMQSARPIPDLETVFLTMAAVVQSYKSVMFLGNVVMDGQRIENRLVWSDFNNAKQWDPALTNITGVISSTLTGHTLSWINPSALSYVVQSRANSTSAWKNFKIVTSESLIVADVTKQYRVASFVSSTITGYQDLSYGHKILGMIELGDYLVILTDKGIWQGTPTGLPPDQGPAFSFRLTYSSNTGAQCIAYRNTLCSIGGSIFYLSREAAYSYNFFQAEPERLAWLHKATGIIFNGYNAQPGINDQCCESHVAQFRPNKMEIWLSWAVVGSCIPSITMVINTDQKFVDTVDHGFTAYCNYRSDSRGTLRDFLLNFCVCTTAELLANGVKYQKEGLPLPTAPGSCAITPTCIYTNLTIPVDPSDPHGQQMEDYTAPTAAADSLCAALGNRTIDDLCRDCNQNQLFVAASVSDRCLKQIGGAYSREQCSNPTATNTAIVYVDANGLVTYQSNLGTYTFNGYYSIWRTGPVSYGIDTVKKQIKRLLLANQAVEQAYPCVVQLRIGVSYAMQDPNAGMTADPNQSQNLSQGCGPVWQQALRKRLACTQSLSPEQYVARKLVPNQGLEFSVIMQAHYFYYEVVIASLSDPSDIDSMLIPATGGQSCFSQIETWAMPLTIDR